MSRHQDKVLAHAEQQLTGEADSDQLLAVYKKFLKIENHRLRLKHYAGGGGREIAQQRAGLLDVVLKHLFEAASASSRRDGSTAPALVATGGYGRGELNPFSDVDIMFLHDGPLKKVSAELSEIVQLILYMLWDIGFKVGHATRSIAGAIEQANAEMLSKTSLLESRFLCGNRALFDEFRMRFEKQCVRGHEKGYITARLADQAERHAKFGGSVYMQEPNIKSGCGGLRDYQNLLWISYFKEGISTTEELQDKKFLTETERRRLDRAYDFLLRVRTELHYLNKRATDVLTLHFQLQVANKFNYPQKNALRRSEAFMRDYYQHARNIYNTTETLSERLAISARQEKAPRILKLFSRAGRPREEHFDGFFSREGKLYAESRDIFTEDPPRMMRMFLHAQQRRLELSPELEQLLRRRLHLVDRTFQYARATRETFSAILSRKGEVGRILRLMHRVDFLGRYMPEFGQLTCLVQHEFFHRYTADEHTLVCIEKLDELIDTDDPKMQGYRELFQKIEEPYVLYLALLLHDTGKSSSARHHAEASALYAQKVAARLQLSPERRRSLILLVDNHMALSGTAQRRNLDDTATIADFAALIKSQRNLDLLMLLTLADGRGTGDEKWSDWKESLVWQLYHSTSQYLKDGEAFYRRKAIERNELRETVAKKMARDFEEEIDAHFDYMPDIYFQNDAASIAAHIRFFRSFLEARCGDSESALAPAVKWVARPDQGHSETWICTWDRHQLLAKIAGSFAAAQLNILSADVFTRGDSLVLDIFRVCDTRFQAVTDEKEMAQVEKYLRLALKEEDFDFQPLLERARRKPTYHLAQELDFPTRIAIDNDTHPTYTLIDVQTPDRLGLLYHLLRAMADEGINIALSRITTEKGAAIDSFYVMGGDGRKLRDAAAVRRLQKALQRAAEKLAA